MNGRQDIYLHTVECRYNGDPSQIHQKNKHQVKTSLRVDVLAIVYRENLIVLIDVTFRDES